MDFQSLRERFNEEAEETNQPRLLLSIAVKALSTFLINSYDVESIKE
jgi:hypothetical protein